MIDLVKASIAEIEYNNQVQSIKGSFDEKKDAIEASGVANKFYQIYMKYIAEIKYNSEALKRALFIQWYSNAEPREMTGLPLFSEDRQKEVLAIVQIQLNEDKELMSMVRHYMTITPWYFDNFELDNNDSGLLEFNFEGRGIMGKYFQSILNL